MKHSLLASLLLGCASIAEAAEPEPQIQDNSFLVEEAYNQEPGVIQHINTYSRSRDGGPWLYTLTEEWPAPSQTHQVGFTLPLLSSPGPGSEHGIGDVALNYRWQAKGDGKARTALAPRLSLLLPTGNEAEDRGAGGWGAQVNLPASVLLAPRFVTHYNLGASWWPNAKSVAGDEAAVWGWNAGASAIWLVHPKVNLMLETVWLREETIVGPDRTISEKGTFVNPGIRFAIDTAGGLQIVPGIAAPIGVGSSSGERQVFVYLSFEHPLW